MPIAIRWGRAACIAGALAVTGCTAVLGDFSNAQTDDDSGVGRLDSGGDTFVPPPPDDGGNPNDSEPPPDASFDAGHDSAIPLGPPGRPGQSLTGGGVTAKSTNFSVFAAIGESPGGNVTATSTSFKLQSGVIGATQ